MRGLIRVVEVVINEYSTVYDFIFENEKKVFVKAPPELLGGL